MQWGSGQRMSIWQRIVIACKRLSLKHNLPMADSIILATAREFKTTIWTQDSDFEDMANVQYFPKK